MKQKLIIGAIVAVVIVAAVVNYPSGETKVTVSFLPVHVETIGTSMKVIFDVTNAAARTVYLEVSAIERQSASVWVADTNTLPARAYDYLGEVGGHGTARLSYSMPYQPTLTRLQVLVAPKATTIQKAQFAMGRLWANVWDRKHYKEFWFDDSAVPSYRVFTPEFQ